MPEIETFKTIYVNINLSVGADHGANIYVEFEVDEVVLKYVAFYNDIPDGPALGILSSELIGGPIFTFPLTTAFFEQMNTPFRVASKQVNGRYNFTLTGINGVAYYATDLTMSLCLLFVKYKKSHTLGI